MNSLWSPHAAKKGDRGEYENGGCADHEDIHVPPFYCGGSASMWVTYPQVSYPCYSDELPAISPMFPMIHAIEKDLTARG